MAERLFPGESALGRRIEIGWWSGAVVGQLIGVVENVRSERLAEPNPPTLYRLGYAYSPRTFLVKTRGEPRALIDDLRERVATLYPTVPLTRVAVVSDYADRQRAPIQFVLTVFALFAVTALTLARIGFCEVVSHVIRRRMREPAVRTVFGASPSHAVALVLRQVLGGSFPAWRSGLRAR